MLDNIAPKHKVSVDCIAGYLDGRKNNTIHLKIHQIGDHADTIPHSASPL